jgi:nucleoside-diphosphate-sugar epimerase
MNLFITGAAGYIGGTVAARLMEAGHRVRGLVRTPHKAADLARSGIEPVQGDLDDVAVLAREAQSADGVVHAASADHAPSIAAFIDALAGTGKPLLHTSGSSVIGDDAQGNRASDRVFDEDSPFVVAPARQPRRDLELSVLAAAGRAVRSAVICPCLIYGNGRGLNPRSAQIPFLVDNARQHGVVQIVGEGANRWSNVHIDDVAELYLLALTKGPAGAYYFAENGEASFAEIGAAIAQRLGLRVESLPLQAAAKAWGDGRARYTFGSNSRVRAKRARRELGWAPRHASALSWVLNEMPL